MDQTAALPHEAQTLQTDQTTPLKKKRTLQLPKKQSGRALRMKLLGEGADCGLADGKEDGYALTPQFYKVTHAGLLGPEPGDNATALLNFIGRRVLGRMATAGPCAEGRLAFADPQQTHDTDGPGGVQYLQYPLMKDDLGAVPADEQELVPRRPACSHGRGCPDMCPRPAAT